MPQWQWSAAPTFTMLECKFEWCNYYETDGTSAECFVNII